MSGKRILDGVKEALAIVRGEKKPAAVWIYDPRQKRMVRLSGNDTVV